jgi:MoaA/NifB/PqqE/SkfB family radical SAM enzyme
MSGGVTLLWALRSPCNMGCTYCYFGTIEEHRLAPPTRIGQLSHLARSDLSLDEIRAFCATLVDSAVTRVFLAGGEPLAWPPICEVIELIKNAAVEVVACTNGLPLNRPPITEALVALGVDAVSVSLDSADPALNDRYRPVRNGTDGWPQVISGIEALVAARGAREHPKVGIYTAVGRHNIDDVVDVARLGVELGVDYYVPQPISLTADHALATELSLDASHTAAVDAALSRLYDAHAAALVLPDPSYQEQFLASIRTAGTLPVASCFGGSQLAFIEPDGSVWDCPSYHRIAATPPEHRRSIRDTSAAALFPPGGQGPCQSCALFSRDCVSMWPLMAFDRVVHPQAEPT